MESPDWSMEKSAGDRGFGMVAGVDEVGRGSWAGPLVAGAVILLPDSLPQYEKMGINDSKLLTPRKREELFCFITANCIGWAIGMVDADIIDREGIASANASAMNQAVNKLKPAPDYLLIDGPGMNGLIDIPRESIVRGDSKSISIAAASIVAKVWRDRLMVWEDGRFPLYGFSRHKGYGTGYHHLMLMKHGLCAIHRRSFEPMRSMEKSSRGN